MDAGKRAVVVEKGPVAWVKIAWRGGMLPVAWMTDVSVWSMAWALVLRVRPVG